MYKRQINNLYYHNFNNFKKQQTMSFTNRRVIDDQGPNYDRGIFFDEKMTQGEVTLNVKYNNGVYANRQHNNKLSQDDKIGHVNSSNELDVVPTELVFMQRFTISKNRGQFIDGRANAFTSFNGIKVGNATTNEQFASQFLPVGFATGPFIVNGKNQTNSGFAVRISGSGTTINNGMSEVRAGDLLVASPPNINPSERKVEREQLPPNRTGVPQSKILGTLEKYDINSNSNLPKEAIRFVLDKSNDGNTDIDLLDPRRGNNLTRIQEVGIAMKQVDLVKGLLFAATMVQAGAMKFVAPENGLNSLVYSRNDAALSLGLDTLNKYGVIEDENGNLVQSNREVDSQELEDKITYYAYKLGLLPIQPGREFLTPNDNLVANILGRQNAGLLPADVSDYYSIDHAFKKSGRTKSISGKRNDLSTVSGYLRKLQHDSSKLAYVVTGNAYHHSKRNIIAKATTYANRGGKMDYIIVQN